MTRNIVKIYRATYFKLTSQPHDTIRKSIQRVIATKEKTTKYAGIIPIKQWNGKDPESIIKLRQILKPFKYLNSSVANCTWNWKTAPAEDGSFWTRTLTGTERCEPHVGVRYTGFPFQAKHCKTPKAYRPPLKTNLTKEEMFLPDFSGSKHLGQQPCRVLHIASSLL